MSRIETDRTVGIIRIAMEGFWTFAEVAAFAGELRRESTAMIQAERAPARFYDYPTP